MSTQEACGISVPSVLGKTRAGVSPDPPGLVKMLSLSDFHMDNWNADNPDDELYQYHPSGDGMTKDPRRRQFSAREELSIRNKATLSKKLTMTRVTRARMRTTGDLL